MFATGGYFHMPEGTASSFLRGESNYGWGMSHEYGHMLDFRPLLVAEETNNMYSIWGARKEAIDKYKKNASDIVDVHDYHPNIVNIGAEYYDCMARSLAQGKEVDPQHGFSENNGFFKVMTWYLATHYFDKYDYSQYNFAQSPYEEKYVQEIKRYGTYGTAQRIVREHMDQYNDSAFSDSSLPYRVKKYNLMILAFTRACGYNLADFFQSIGEREIDSKIKEECAKYPKVPVKLIYYTLNADGKEAMEYPTYKEEFPVEVKVSEQNGKKVIQANIPNEEKKKATIGYELYKNGKLVDYSTDG